MDEEAVRVEVLRIVRDELKGRDAKPRSPYAGLTKFLEPKDAEGLAWRLRLCTPEFGEKLVAVERLRVEQLELLSKVEALCEKFLSIPPATDDPHQAAVLTKFAHA
jgi:hypothetical protein